MSNPNHNWIPFYHHQPDVSNYLNQIPLQAPLSAAATTSTTTVTATTRTNTLLTPNQGRVSRPIRRRTRTSRRAPTTLLNTDTANFRAMVQHFTGSPAAAAATAAAATTFSPIPHLPSGAMINVAPPLATVMDPATGIHAEYVNQMQQGMALMDGDKGGMGPARPAGSSSGNENWDFDSYMGY